MMADSGFIELDGVRLELRCFGQPQGDDLTLILLHEGLGCVALWRDFPEQLHHRTGLPVIAYSRQGYGRSDPCSLPRPISYMHIEAEQVLPALLGALGLNNVMLIGHSDGASIATIYAGSRQTPAPRGLVLMAPHFFVEEISLTSIKAALNAYQETQLRQRLAKYHGDNVDCAFLGWNGAWLNRDFQDWDIRDYLSTCPCPILAIQGKDDEYGTLAQVETAKELAPGPVSVEIFPQCGHAPQNDQTADTLAAIERFAALFQQV